MIKIDDLIERICQYGALAARRYVEVSGEGLWTMPESFMPPFIFDRIGGTYSTTLETSFEFLKECYEETRQRRGLPSRAESNRLTELRQELGWRRIDMVFFEGEEEGKPKKDQDAFALVEFKRGYVSEGDREKLKMFLEYFDLWKWGVLSGWTTEDQRPTARTESPWHEVKIELPAEIDSTKCIFYAQYFSNPYFSA